MQGQLAGLSPADILSDIQRRKGSGILRFASDGVTRQIFIDAGVMVRFAASTHSKESLTQLLRQRGLITDAQLKEASTAKKPDELLGTVLARLGFLPRESLIAITQEHVRRVVHGALLLKQGQWEFQQGGLPFREQLDAGVPTPHLLLEWSRDVPDLGLIRSRLGSLETKIRVSPHPPEGYQSIPLNPPEGYTMSRVDGNATMREICIVSPMGEDTTLRALFGLIMAGILDNPAMTQAAVVMPERPAAAPRSGPDARAVDRTHGAGRAAGRPGAPPGAVLGSRVPGNGGAPRTRRRAKPPAPPRVERVRPATSADLEQEMLDRFQKLNENDLYAVLGVDNSSGSDDVRRSYYGLAKRFHPDKFTREAMKAKAEKVFAHITQAYSTLGNAQAREKYDEDLAIRSSATQERTVDTSDLAKMNFRTGRENFDKGRFAEALSFFQNACEQDPKKAEYWYYLGLTQSKNPRWKKDAEASFLESIRIDPCNADAYAHLGALYARGRLVSKAKEMYEKALQWDSTHAFAQEGLEALGDPGGGKKGFMGLFRK